MITITGFLRGINVGGHHKVPMAELRKKLEETGCENVRTLLNSGNIVFDTDETDIIELENRLEQYISKCFGFAIPVILRSQKDIRDLIDADPFKEITLHKDIRLYVSFLKDKPGIELPTPYISDDKSYRIISVRDRIILSVLDLSITSTPKGMDNLEKLFGKNITTRNWNTIKKMAEV